MDGIHTIDEKERYIQEFWEKNNIFKKSLVPKKPQSFFERLIRKIRGARLFIFFDGPPFATGLPHHGHILAGTIKDVIPRYRTMRGYIVPRRWGWDCHGLPLEVSAEKELGISGRDAIEAYGVDTFNSHIRSEVLRYEKDWKQIIPRLGRFVDMDCPYKTMDPSYTESVWSIFSRLYGKGLAYKGFNNVHMCPRCETILSNHEVAQGYQNKKDIAVYATLPLKNEKDTSLVIWTTTPWTLPANTAVGVHKDISYCFVKKENHIYVVSEKQRNIIENGSVEKTVKGEELIGLEYEPFFVYYEKERKNGAFRVHHAEYVAEDSGTGIVHLAPAFGEEDLILARKENIPIINNVLHNGVYDDTVSDFKGRIVRSVDAPQGLDSEIVDTLRAKGRVITSEEIEHEYPFCWRCKTPLLNYASNSWFVAVSRFRDGLLRANRTVSWVPDHLRDGRFGSWLVGARDWAISRNRFWGAPLPVWSNSETHIVVDSLKTMKKYLPKPKNDILCVRHCFADSNERGIANGDRSKDKGLVGKGVQQAKELGKKIQQADFIYSSPMPRSLQTAEYIAIQIGIPKENIVVDQRLIETQFGEVEGASFADKSAMKNTSPEHTFGTHTAGAESFDDISKRMISFIYDIDKRHNNKRILIVSHKLTLEFLLSHCKGVIFEPTDGHNKRFEKQCVRISDHGKVYPLYFQPFPLDETYTVNFHRPYIDTVTLYDKKGKRYTHCGEVFDCWFESGAMPYGSQHYLSDPINGFNPIKKKKFPADFIAEGLDQTRGWFYSLMVLGYGCFDVSPYKSVVTNGLVLAEGGKKLSKSEKNFTDPMELVQKVGADSLRFFLINSAAPRGESLLLSDERVEEQKRKVVDRLYNSLHFYNTVSKGLEEVRGTPTYLDRWMDARLAQTCNTMTKALDTYDIQKAARAFAFLVDDLSLWYVRRIRTVAKQTDKQGAYARYHLKKTLRTISHLGAPLIPFVTEYMYQELKEEGDVESVHLARWPEQQEVDTQVLKQMEMVREITSKALQLRTESGIRVRQPLQQLNVPCNIFINNEELSQLIQEEINVKQIRPFNEKEITLDITMTEALLKEGFVREIVRAIQRTRREKKYAVDEIVNIFLYTDIDLKDEKYLLQQMTKSTINIYKDIYTGSDGEEIVVGEMRVVFVL